MTQTDDLDTIHAAEVLGISDRWLRTLIKQGELIPDRITQTTERKFYYFRPETIEAFKRQREGKTSETVRAR